MASTSMSLGKHWENYLQEKVESGQFKTKTEVLREALRQHEMREKKLTALDAYIQEGDDSGYVDWDPEAFARRVKSKHLNVAEDNPQGFDREN